MNSIGYFEIQSDNPQKALEFYGKIFDWKFTKQDGLPIEYYQIETEGIRGGLLKRPMKTPPQGHGTNAYVCSIEVENFDQTAEQILNLGGIIAMDKFAIPGKCWQGYFLDLDGNTFGLFQVDDKAS
jgi:predicted enzyme related to lactoylglutathione lyase